MADHDHTFAGMAAVFLTPTLSDGSVPLMRILAFCLLSALISAPANAADAERELIFLILLDAVRADAVSSYGYDKPTTPVLDRLAENGGALYAHVRQRAVDSPFNGELLQRAERLSAWCPDGQDQTP